MVEVKEFIKRITGEEVSGVETSGRWTIFWFTGITEGRLSEIESKIRGAGIRATFRKPGTWGGRGVGVLTAALIDLLEEMEEEEEEEEEIITIANITFK